MKKKNIFNTILIILCLISLIVLLFFNKFVLINNTKFINLIINILTLFLIFCLIFSYFFKKNSIFKLSIALTCFFILSFIIYFFLLNKGMITKIQSLNDIKQIILKYKKWGMLTYTILMFLQVIVIPLPSTLTILAGTIIFGPTQAFIFASIGILLGSIIAFLIGRFLSRPVVNWIFGKEQINSYEKLLAGKTKLILFLMLFLPFFPDDLICMIAGITNIKFKDFLWISFISRSFGIATISFFGSGEIIPFNTWWGILIWGVIAITMAIITIVLYKKRNKIIYFFAKKRHTTK